MTGPLSRRRALSGAATLGVGLPILAACSDDGGDGGGDASPTPSDAPTSAASSNEATAEAPSSDESSAPSGGLVAASDVPVGGGVVLNDEEIVVTQPTDGEFKAFTAICTHTGCLVGSVNDGTIDCPCHGSKFSVTDGSVSNGPASSPLAEVGVTVKDGQVVRS